MYDTVDCTKDQPSSIHQTKQTINDMMDGDNYDIITHVEEDENTRARNKNSSDSAPGTKSAEKSKEKRAATPEKEIIEVEYSVPDKTYKKIKQNAGKAAGTTLEQGTSSTSSGGQSTSLEYSNLLHVTSSSTQRLSMPPPTSVEYSNIAHQDTGKSKRNESTTDVRSSSHENGRRRGRTCSPPEEPPPPLPPPFVEEENPTIKEGLQSSALSADLSTLYDDPDNLATSESQQEMYMNVGKK